MTNPYQPPPSLPEEPDGRNELKLPPAQEPGLVGHVRVVAILMMVQGVLEILMGLFWGAMAALFPTLTTFLESQQNQPPPPDEAFWFIIVLYGGIGVVHLAVGILHAFAGYRNYAFKSRTLGIVALSSGMGTLFGCYCLPTAVALSVYGLIVYLNGPVARAFAMGEEGYPGDAILVTFSPYRSALSSPGPTSSNPHADTPFQQR
jgi:hypothetical protein